MGHPSGFLNFDRKTGHYAAPQERVKTWKEFTETLPDEELQKQGARCMDCGIPFCHSTGCPVYNLIPEWNDLVYQGDWREALIRLEMTNNLPGDHRSRLSRAVRGILHAGHQHQPRDHQAAGARHRGAGLFRGLGGAAPPAHAHRQAGGRGGKRPVRAWPPPSSCAEAATR